MPVAVSEAPEVQISHSASSVSKVDVVVVGAGLAGLTAARNTIEAGYTCVVLEARNRVGGRSWSKKLLSSECVCDVGAAWINDTNQSHVYALAKEFGAELLTQNIEGSVILQDTDRSIRPFFYGGLPSFSEDVRIHVANIRDAVEAECQSLDVNVTRDDKSAELDAMTFLEYLQRLGATDKAIETATIWTRAMVGQEPFDMSALFFLHYCKAGGGLMQMRADSKHGGQYLRVRQGTQMFALNIAKSLPEGVIHFNSAVTSVEQLDPEDIMVSCVDKSCPIFRARRIIMAIPPTVLKTVKFTPPLPESKRLLIESYNYGFYQKVHVLFRTPFWVEKGSCGLTQSFVGPACVTRDTSVLSENSHIITCFMGGAQGKKWSELPTEEDRREAILAQIGAIYDDEDLVRSQYVEMMGLKWADEEWSGYGCPSTALPPGVLSPLGHELKSNFGSVYFAGTETSDVWRGYMEGAVRSGEREATRIIGDLQKSNA